MTHKPDYLDPDWIATAPYGESGCWVIGFVFSSKDAGIGTMKAIAELYNKTAGMLPPDAGGESQDRKEG